MANNVQTNCINPMSNYVLDIGVTGGLTYLAAKVMTTINPTAALIYAVTSSVAAIPAKFICDKLFHGDGANLASKVLGWALKFFISASIGLACTAIGGVPLVAASVITLTLFQVGASLIAGGIKAGIWCCNNAGRVSANSILSLATLAVLFGQE